MHVYLSHLSTLFVSLICLSLILAPLLSHLNDAAAAAWSSAFWLGLGRQ
jgi:hypothetical protein